MAQDPGTGKFPAENSDDEKTDPNLVIPEDLQKKRRPPQPSASAEAPPEIPQPSALPEEPPIPPARPQPPVRMPEMGPLDAMMKDPSISEIMVNDLRNVMIEKEGKLSFSGFSYQSIDELNRLTRNILDITGRILSPDQPYVDVSLPDGSRGNIVAPPPPELLTF
ncbi:MAG: Flp pilus assembly complex ATPase component TadA [Bdellovibrio sp.]|nr:Flp pilus assembly complex ATPase component TadA [Bdellovibrio sp.]